MAGKRRTVTGPTKDQELLELIGAVYEVALAPQDLPSLLSRVVRFCDAVWAPMSIVPLSGGPVMSFHNAEGDPGHLDLFNSRYVKPEHNPASMLLLRSQPGELLLREHHFSDSDWEHREIYHEIYRPIGAYASLGVVLHNSRHFFAPLGIMKPKSRGDFDAEDLTQLSRIVPHLMQMMAVLCRLNDLTEQAAAGAALWDRMPYGVMLLDESRRLLWANRAAEEILSDGDGLALNEGMLGATTPADNAALQGLVAGAASTGSARGTSSGGSITLSRKSGKRALSIQVAPFVIGRGPTIVSRRAAAVVFASDPERGGKPPWQVLAQLYRLTPREAGLAVLLADGCELREAADSLGVGMSTLRTHLHQIFWKTGTRRQAELVSLLHRSLVLPARPR